MTRVWKAKEISEFGGPSLGKEPVALKDVWLDQDAKTELEIQNEIFKAIKREKELFDANLISRLDFLPTEIRNSILVDFDNDNFRKYFMAIDCDDVGQTTKPIPADAVPTAGLFKQKEKATRAFSVPGSDRSRARDIAVRPSPNTTAAMQTDISTRSEALSSAPTPSPAPAPTMDPTTDNDSSPMRSYKPKNRYYLVFAEVGLALYDVPTLPILFLALRDILLGEFIELHRTTPCSLSVASTGFPVYWQLGSS